MSIALILNYARSGGTLLSKCLASMPETVLISEVHPSKCAVSTIQEQAKQWYDIDLKNEAYLPAVLELYSICQQKNKQLIIRDWTFFDFTPHTVNNFTVSQQFSALELLNTTSIPIKSIAFIRDPIDVWISRWKPPKFFFFYKKYIEKLSNKSIPIFKYEDFCKAPHKELKIICKHLSIKYSEAFQNYNLQQNVTGDNLTAHTSRGEKAGQISVLKRKQIAKREISWLHQNTDLQAISQMTAYSPNYFARSIENKHPSLLINTKYFLKKALQIKPKDEF